MSGIILFDGVCNLCTSSVQFIIKRDPQAMFIFASLQSEAGQRLLKQYYSSSDLQKLDSFVLIETNKNIAFEKSTAALMVAKQLSGLVKLLYPLIFIPSPLRDVVYNFIAKRRYRWFGRRQQCMLPTTKINKRFLD